uniref:Uncharacterized protein n=1 Tax=Lygus hesperus TaxID=30085 RepID=A0A146MD21_LYGHE
MVALATGSPHRGTHSGVCCTDAAATGCSVSPPGSVANATRLLMCRWYCLQSHPPPSCGVPVPMVLCSHNARCTTVDSPNLAVLHPFQNSQPARYPTIPLSLTGLQVCNCDSIPCAGRWIAAPTAVSTVAPTPSNAHPTTPHTHLCRWVTNARGSTTTCPSVRRSLSHRVYDPTPQLVRGYPFAASAGARSPPYFECRGHFPQTTPLSFLST